MVVTIFFVFFVFLMNPAVGSLLFLVTLLGGGLLSYLLYRSNAF